MEVRKMTTVLESDDIEQATALRVEAFGRDTAANGVVVVDGSGLRIHVKRGALVIEDGAGNIRRSRRFDKATHGMSRIAVLGKSGSISIEALHSCRRLGIAVVVLAPDGSSSLASTPRFTDDARLRRLQGRAPDLAVGLDLARFLIGRKLRQQSDLLSARFCDDERATALAGLSDSAACVDDVIALRGIEATGAVIYWQAWVGRPESAPQFSSRDVRRGMPRQWAQFEGRRSVLAAMTSNRKAERPVNAILNFLYGLLEAEAILACHVVGLDAGLGLVHSDTKGRASFALDLMEPVRPLVDAYVLDLLASRTFRKGEFTETTEGHCRLLSPSPLTAELCETLPMWARDLAPLAEHAAHAFGQALDGKYVPTTPLTALRARASRQVIAARQLEAKGRRETPVRNRQLPTTPIAAERWCVECGAQVLNVRRVRCDDCIALDAKHSAATRTKRGKAIASRKRTLAEWDRANPGVTYDPELFRREILPGLSSVTLARIMEAADCSKSYASQIRRGHYSPHVSTWPALRELVRAQGGPDLR
jgi:CRISPR-associated endonuclease Cas1